MRPLTSRNRYYDKVEGTTVCLATRDVHEVRSALGLFSHYQRFIPHFSEIAKHLIRLTEKDRSFSWGKEQQVAFDHLKEILGQTPILSNPQTEGQFILDTDTISEGIGAVLSQMEDEEEKVIACGSKTLYKVELNYCFTRREVSAVVYFLQQFKLFLLGKKFLIRTDNSAV